MSRSLIVLAALGLSACGPKAAPQAAAEEAASTTPAREMPAPLPERPFTMPEVQEATLSNGLTVRVVANDEVPLFSAQLLLRTGGVVDPEGKKGLASLTFAMMDEGADGKDAAALAGAVKALGGTLSAGAGLDLASVRVSGPTRNLAGLLDLWADVLLRPDFPEEDWEIVHAKRLKDFDASLSQPNTVASRVMQKLAFDGRYAGRLTTREAYEGITLDDVRSFHDTWVTPDHGMLLVGGDVDLDTLVPLLEARLAEWTPGDSALPEVAADPAPTDAAAIYFVHEEGAQQSVIRSFLPVIHRLDERWFDLYMANTALGGAFTARVNMNLREDKGYTYGARCGFDHGLGDSLWYCGTSVATPVTGPSMTELMREVDEAVSTRPITPEEHEFFTSFRVNAFAGSFETSSDLLGEVADGWAYGLPTDWLERYVPGVLGVTVDSANAALQAYIAPDKVTYVVVGDRDAVLDDLTALGLPVIEVDHDANPVETP